MRYKKYIVEPIDVINLKQGESNNISLHLKGTTFDMKTFFDKYKLECNLCKSHEMNTENYELIKCGNCRQPMARFHSVCFIDYETIKVQSNIKSSEDKSVLGEIELPNYKKAFQLIDCTLIKGEVKEYYERHLAYSGVLWLESTQLSPEEAMQKEKEVEKLRQQKENVYII